MFLHRKTDSFNTEKIETILWNFGVVNQGKLDIVASITFQSGESLYLYHDDVEDKKVIDQLQKLVNYPTA